MKIFDKGYQPVNKLAARVVFGEKIHFIPEKVLNNVFESKPTCFSEKDIQEKALQSGCKIKSKDMNKFCKDILGFVGQDFGRLTVVGALKFKNKPTEQPKTYLKFAKKFKTFNDVFSGSLPTPVSEQKGKNRSGTRRYVCRCSCGYYCHYAKKVLLEKRKTKCPYCDYIEYLRNGKKWGDGKNE